MHAQVEAMAGTLRGGVAEGGVRAISRSPFVVALALSAYRRGNRVDAAADTAS
jgi:hypothetical protein